MSSAEIELEIPSVALADLMKPEPGNNVLEAIRNALGRYGLIYITGHEVGVPKELYRTFARFTGKTDQEKSKYHREDLWYQRGWTPPNTEKAVVAEGQPDFKECWFAAPKPFDPELVSEFPELYAANIWPEGVDLEPGYMSLGDGLHQVGTELLAATAVALGLPRNTFQKALDGGPHVLRLLRYLPLTQAQIEQNVLWGEEHTDFNLLTLLPGGQFVDPAGEFQEAPDKASGLFLRTRPSKEHPQGLMVRGQPPKGAIVAQVGQQLEILTGGAMIATPHVITAPKSVGWSRFSSAYFIHLRSREVLSPLGPFLTPQTREAYRPPVLAGTFSLKTLVDIGLAPASALGRLGYRHYDRLAGLRQIK